MEEVKDEVIRLRQLTNCDRIAVSGGEPLLHPEIVDLIGFIAGQGIKPVLLTNGETLTWELAKDLQRAGLAKFHFHVDSGMQRPGWTGKSEAEMNELRQHYADMVWELEGVQCGFNVTVFRATLQYLPEVLEWCRQNVHKVQHISLVAFRAILLTGDVEYRVRDERIDIRKLQHTTDDADEISVTAEDMFAVMQAYDAGYRACAYLSGSSAPETYKFLITVQVGSPRRFYGYLGARTLECVQVVHHLVKGRYCSFLREAKIGRKLFLMSVLDQAVRETAGAFFKSIIKSPLSMFDGMYVQSVSLQQPNEVVRGQANLCDGCLNMMLYQDQLIPSCRLDEYRMFGDLITPVPLKLRNRGNGAP